MTDYRTFIIRDIDNIELCYPYFIFVLINSFLHGYIQQI